jgi:murein DD-endopeptidase MepM/ murein hydrolase activator NlpD
MIKNILFITLFVNILFANSNLDKKIISNKLQLQKEAKNKKATKKEIKKLAHEIIQEENKSNVLENKLNILSNNIFLNKIKLKKSKRDLKKLDEQSILIQNNTKQIEEKIVNSIIDKYSITLSKKLINKESKEDVIEQEKYSLILDITKDKILKSNIQYFKIQNDKRKNNDKAEQISKYIKLQQEQKNEFDVLKNKQEISLNKLKLKHKIYLKTLNSIIKKQSNLNSLLSDLDILKKRKTKKEKLNKLKKSIAKRKEKKRQLARNKAKKIKLKFKPKTSNAKTIKLNSKKLLEENISLNVKKIGSSVKGIKISNYRGKKTIAPLKSFVITKKFGKYFDPVYKIELFNESVSLKSKIKNAKVSSVLKGKVIYAKSDAGTLGNVVVIQHKNALHTVYSQLSNIPTSLKVGKWIPKGYVVGRVKETLVFQATKNNKYINPIKLFKGISKN